MCFYYETIFMALIPVTLQCFHSNNITRTDGQTMENSHIHILCVSPKLLQSHANGVDLALHYNFSITTIQISLC